MYKYPAHGLADPIPLRLISVSKEAITTAMADYSCNITLVNGYTSSKLTRISYHVSQGHWITPPRAEIPAGESDTYGIAPDNSKRSHPGGQARSTNKPLLL